MNETYYVKTEEKEHTVKIQNEEKKFYSYDGELVEDPTGTLVEKTITENGEYLPASDNADGYSKVTVNVPVPVNKLPQVADKTITEITKNDLEGSTFIGEYAFYNCNRLISVAIPSTITYIAGYSFYGCTSLQNITFPNSVTYLYNRAFYGCSNLLTVEMGDAVTYIDYLVFSNCTRLQSVTIRAVTPPQLAGNSAFNNTGNCPIYVPAESVEVYKAATNWASLASRIFAIQE